MLIMQDFQLLNLSESGLLSEMLFEYLSEQKQWTIELLTWLLLLIQAIYICLIANRNRLTSDYLLLPGAMYLLVMHAIPPFLPFSSILLANTFLIIAISQLLNTYRNQKCIDKIFNVGFWIAIASLFHFSYLFFLVAAFLGLATLRAFKGRELLVLFVGAITVYLLVGTYAFWQDSLYEFWQEHVRSNIGLLDFEVENVINNYIALGIVALLLLIVLLGYISVIRRQNIQFQKKVKVLYWVLLICGVSTIFYADNVLAQAAILSVPNGILLGLLLANISQKAAEIVHLLLIVAIIAWQWHPYWLT